MVVPLIPIIIGGIASVAVGAGLSKGGGSGISAPSLFEIGTSKKQITTQDSYSYQSSLQFSPTTSNNFSFSPTDIFQPNNEFAPVTLIGSPNSSVTSKKESSLSTDLQSAFSPSTNPVNTLEPSQSTAQTAGGAGGDDLFGSIKQVAVLGGIGFLVYTFIKRKKK